MYAKQHRTIPKSLLDEINDNAMDTIGDQIADESGITEKYYF